MTSPPSPRERLPGVSKRARVGYLAAGWALIFAGFHFYWALGGRLGMGDGAAAHSAFSTGFLLYDLLVALLCLVGAVVVLALVGGLRWPTVIPGWILSTVGWIGTVLLLVRGGLGLIEDVLQLLGLLNDGLLGMTTQQMFGEPHPSAYTMWSLRAIDVYFLLGGLLFVAALRHRGHRRRTQGTPAPVAARLAEPRPDR